jgi:hypothetical protein
MGMCDAIDRGSGQTPQARERACRILAKTIYRELRQNGFAHKEIVAIAGDLISQVTDEMRPEAEIEDDEPMVEPLVASAG